VYGKLTVFIALSAHCRLASVAVSPLPFSSAAALRPFIRLRSSGQSSPPLPVAMGALQSGFHKFSNGLTYNTVQIVKIKNPRLCLIHLALQIGIVAYVAVYVIGLKRGYQSTEVVVGTSALKVKGSAYNEGGQPWLKNASDLLQTPSPPPPPMLEQIFDSNDLIVPPYEREALFITTNLWITDNQTRSRCYPGSNEWWTAQFPAADNAAAEAACAAVCVKGTISNEADKASGGVLTGSEANLFTAQQQLCVAPFFHLAHAFLCSLSFLLFLSPATTSSSPPLTPPPLS
jgi:hypothetical protein